MRRDAGSHGRRNVGSHEKERTKMVAVTEKLLQVLNQPEEKPNRHLSFFQGIIPSLESMTETQVLQFQAGVLKLIIEIKATRNYTSRFMTSPTHLPPSTVPQYLPTAYSTESVNTAPVPPPSLIHTINPLSPVMTGVWSGGCSNSSPWPSPTASITNVNAQNTTYFNG